MVTVGQGSLADVSLLISQGSTNTYVFFYSKMIATVKTPINLSGFTVASQIRDMVGGVLLLQLDKYITLGADGSVKMVIPAADTRDLKWMQGVWDLELTETLTNTVTRFASGTVAISPEITHA